MTEEQKAGAAREAAMGQSGAAPKQPLGNETPGERSADFAATSTGCCEGAGRSAASSSAWQSVHSEGAAHAASGQHAKDVMAAARETTARRGLANADSPVLLMVSGGSDSTALAYIARQLADEGVIGPVAMLHVNHCLRPGAADQDEAFVTQLAELLAIPLFSCKIDIAGEAQREGGNVEAVARRERYLAANEALASLCRHAAAPLSAGRIFTAHTADDRVENFYMRSMVGTGPGGFRAMKYANGPVARPLLDIGREDLRVYLRKRERDGLSCACDAEGNLWREDATNAHTDRFRAYVRHEVIPHIKQRSPQLLDVLGRTMNLIADEDDFMEGLAREAAGKHLTWVCQAEGRDPDWQEGFKLSPSFGQVALPVARRAIAGALQRVLGADARVETAAVAGVLDAFGEERPKSGYVTNIQGDLAVSANKRGVLVEPMSAFRARRKK